MKKHVYRNGLTLIVDEAPQLKSVAIAAWVKTGTRNEPLEFWGMSHFLEHMLFKGTKKRGAMEISKAVDRVGGDFNAFTSREHTCFHFYLPAKEIKLGASLLKDILFKPEFAAKEIEKERAVILQEIAMTSESPEDESFDLFLEKCFGKHPLARQILGSKETISRLNRKNIFEFFHTNYRPENMVFAVSGAVGFEKVRREFAALGNPWPNRKEVSATPTRWGMDPPTPIQPGFHWKTADSEQAHLWYGFDAPTENAKERVASAIIQQYMGGGMSSVLFDEIREKKGWAYSVYATALQFLDANVFMLYAGVKPERVMDSLKIFKRELNIIAKRGVPKVDFKRIQESMLCAFDLSLESSESRMMTISHSELFYKRDLTLKQYTDLVMSVKPKDAEALMKRWLARDSATVFVMGKKPRKKTAKKKTKKRVSKKSKKK